MVATSQCPMDWLLSAEQLATAHRDLCLTCNKTSISSGFLTFAIDGLVMIPSQSICSAFTIQCPLLAGYSLALKVWLVYTLFWVRLLTVSTIIWGRSFVHDMLRLKLWRRWSLKIDSGVAFHNMKVSGPISRHGGHELHLWKSANLCNLSTLCRVLMWLRCARSRYLRSWRVLTSYDW